MVRRSKRKHVMMMTSVAGSASSCGGGSITTAAGGGSSGLRVRRSRRNIAARIDDNKLYGLDYGILPSD